MSRSQSGFSKLVTGTISQTSLESFSRNHIHTISADEPFSKNNSNAGNVDTASKFRPIEYSRSEVVIQHSFNNEHASPTAMRLTDCALQCRQFTKRLQRMPAHQMHSTIANPPNKSSFCSSSSVDRYAKLWDEANQALPLFSPCQSSKWPSFSRHQSLCFLQPVCEHDLFIDSSLSLAKLPSALKELSTNPCNIHAYSRQVRGSKALFSECLR